MFARVPSKSQEPIGAFADARLPTHILGLVEEILTSPHRSDRDTSLKILSDALTDRSLSPSVGAWMERLGELGEAYLYYHPRELPFCLKQAAYQEVAESKIEFEGFSTCLQVLPNGTLVVGGGREGNGMILIFPKDGKTGSYGEAQVLKECSRSTFPCLQVLPDGSIVANGRGGNHDMILIFPKDSETGSYGEPQGLRDRSLLPSISPCLQVLPNGTIVAGGESGSICIWSKNDETGSYGEVPQQILRGAGNTRVASLQVLPNGTIVSIESTHARSTVRTWTGRITGVSIVT